jgi:hypothetical protein
LTSGFSDPADHYQVYSIKPGLAAELAAAGDVTAEAAIATLPAAPASRAAATEMPNAIRGV